MSSGQTTVPPSPATRPTLLTWLSPMRASGDMTVMSQSRAIVAARPMQSPLMAQTIGLSSSSRRLTMRRLIIGSWTSPSSSTSPPGRSDIALTSPPTLKIVPAPVSSTALTAVSSARSSQIERNSRISRWLIALRASGRLRVTVATLSATSIFRSL